MSQYTERQFDYLLPTHKSLLTTMETARILAREKDFVLELVDQGKLESHQDSAFGNRLSNRITKRSIALHLARTSNLPSDELLTAAIEAVKTFTSAQRARLISSLLPGCTPDQLTQIIREATRRRAQL